MYQRGWFWLQVVRHLTKSDLNNKVSLIHIVRWPEVGKDAGRFPSCVTLARSESLAKGKWDLQNGFRPSGTGSTSLSRLLPNSRTQIRVLLARNEGLLFSRQPAIFSTVRMPLPHPRTSENSQIESTTKIRSELEGLENWQNEWTLFKRDKSGSGYQVLEQPNFPRCKVLRETSKRSIIYGGEEGRECVYVEEGDEREKMRVYDSLMGIVLK